MSKRKKKTTQASFVKVLTVDELSERQRWRQIELSSRGVVAIPQAMNASGGLDRLKKLAAESEQSVKEFVAKEQSLLRQEAIDLAESEYCLEPDEIAHCHGLKDQLPIERRQHLESCTLCQSVVEAAVNSDSDVMGPLLAKATSRGIAPATID